MTITELTNDTCFAYMNKHKQYFRTFETPKMAEDWLARMTKKFGKEWAATLTLVQLTTTVTAKLVR